MDESFPVLYILMRSDLDSMNPGKGMAQASHAANAFMKTVDDGQPNTTNQDLANKWRSETPQGFGTVLVLEVNELEMRSAVDIAKALGFIADVIHDPTYPLRDGDFCHFLPLDTCSYIFGDKNDPMLNAVVKNFPLHP